MSETHEGGWSPVTLVPRRAGAGGEVRLASAGLGGSPASSPRGRVGLVSLGCPKNLVDGEVMLGRLRERGYALTSDPAEADVLVVNTCAFIDRAKQESVDAILEMARLKAVGGARRLVVTGCLAQRYDGELRREIPEIDATLGTGQVDGIVAAVDGADTVTDAEEGLPSWIYDHTAPRVLSTPPWLAYLKISEGCDYTCSFCIIPKLRGLHRSRPLADIVAEARALAARGVRELVLVAQDSTRYGLDLGIRHGLAELLKRLGDVPGPRWIRVMYAYPATMTDAVLDAIAAVPTVAKYVDMPLQHAAESVLKRMKRPTGRGQLLGMVERVRERVPGVAFRTSFIVGFPGETAAEFEELVDFVRVAEFDNVGVFPYSDEEGTPAYELGDRVPSRVKQARRRRLMSLQKRISLRRNRRRLGEQALVLVEGSHPDTDLLLRGRTAQQAPEIDGSVLINDTGDQRLAAGEFVTVELTEAHPYDLVGRVVEAGGVRRPA